MEKLIDLANQFELEREKLIESFKDNELPLWKWYIDDKFGDICYESNKDFNGEDCYGDTAISVFISKNYGFIKFLLDNNKIETDKLKKIGYEEIIYGYDGQYREIVKYSDYESLLMLLSISSSPIEDLVSYLK